MKVFSLFSLLLLLSSNQLLAQCCDTKTAHCEFQKLADNSSFAAEHDEPEEITYEAKGEWIAIPSTGKDARAYQVKQDSSNKWIFVFHEWWGLNEYVQREADKYAREFKVNVLALDLYDSKLADNREDAAKYMKAAKEERIRVIIQAGLDYTEEDAIATIGWCFGGGWSLQASMMAKQKSKACVIYYGMPEKDLVKLNAITAPVLGIWAKQDGWINEEVVQSFGNKMQKLNKEFQSETYDAAHAFANPSNPKFNKEASAEAYGHVTRLLVSQLLGVRTGSSKMKIESPKW